VAGVRTRPMPQDQPPTGARLAHAAAARWLDAVGVDPEPERRICHLHCRRADLADVCAWLFNDLGYAFATLVVEEHGSDQVWSLTYVFYDSAGGDWAMADLRQPLADMTVPSISERVHAADWHEREAEDLFGLVFEGHPKLGEFVLHEEWPEGVNPMRKAFDAREPLAMREPDPRWQPDTIVQAPGAFAMPIGPVFSDFAEAAHFLLETVGEDVIVTVPRFFYKYRGVEKIAEGQPAEHALLLAERFSGSSAFAHGLAFCQVVETIGEAEVPPRARALRTLLAELERLRHHAAAITGICGSTALAVATSQAAILEEDLLRLSGAFAGHRYLFGLLQLGGMTRDLATDACARLADEAGEILDRMRELERMLRYSSSFLDRLEEVGMVARAPAFDYGLVGPIARASGVVRDLRKLHPYAAYDGVEFVVPTEQEGDGYARLRVLFREAEQAVAIIRQIATDLPQGPVAAPTAAPRAGVALGAVEAPLGAAFHWVRLREDGVVVRWRITPPSFTNWHGFHLAAENFAFQDFPIIMASFGLSNVECDR
jgi:Ni,Fe-hydrogenase III large subunit/Ni,Fe-hydrogenase III component G